MVDPNPPQPLRVHIFRLLILEAALCFQAGDSHGLAVINKMVDHLIAEWKDKDGS